MTAEKQWTKKVYIYWNTKQTRCVRGGRKIKEVKKIKQRHIHKLKQMRTTNKCGQSNDNDGR